MIVFIYGPPASGKTTVGEKIARELMGEASFTNRFQASNIEPVLKCARKPKI